ncbi:RNA polymerase sigma factor [Dawidia soli]|uniref:Sigma-70 family RNA polymerase sigma factor n=1 Tax=Dawidia soli TaxID=2782352 RepID=A0AAP2DBJ0_9BACT|nr:sigma-70 family RNA polymerase sigma factor [Dawidia soli]MBT1687600.1 sigma-70 family RNA polymerase sigma factor [Dawidia soli]
MDLRIRSLIKDIKEDNHLVLKALYNYMRPEFLSWFSRHYYCRIEDVEDAYQRSFNIFYFNVREDKVAMQEIKASTYLFSIGRNIMLQVLNKEPKNKTSLENVHEHALEHVSIDYDMEDAYRKEVIVRLLNQLDETCRNVLVLSFYRDFSMESIASELNFKSESVAKKKKHLCMKKLKELVDKHNIVRDSLA